MRVLNNRERNITVVSLNKCQLIEYLHLQWLVYCVHDNVRLIIFFFILNFLIRFLQFGFT